MAGPWQPRVSLGSFARDGQAFRRTLISDNNNNNNNDNNDNNNNNA